jgi:hypothetical protein
LETGPILGSTTATYSYDGDGKRAGKTVNGVPKAFLYDVKASVPGLISLP